jgi:hypothetical protein
MNRLFHRLLSIDPSSNKMVLLIIPPVYALWQYAVAAAAQRRLRKQSFLLDLVFTINVFIWCWPLLLILIPKDNLKNVPEHLAGPAIAFIVIYTQLLVPVILTRLTVKAERLQDPERHYSLAESKDYILRFFSFYMWMFCIWVLQREVGNKIKLG